MEERQIWFFKFGCWAALSIAIALLVFFLIGPTNPSTEQGRAFRAFAMAEQFHLPGGSNRTLMDVINGFNLALCVVLAGIGATGLMVAKRGHRDALLMLSVSRALALMGLVLVGLSLAYFFIVPTVCLALMTFCFAFASVSKT